MKKYEEYNLPSIKDIKYKALVRTRARKLHSDGCTFVTELYHDACFEHDIHWRTKKTLNGDPIGYFDANTIFRERLQELSPFDGFSPLAWWRYLGVTLAALFRVLVSERAVEQPSENQSSSQHPEDQNE